MTKSTLATFVKQVQADRSVIVGAAKGFDFQASLKRATEVRIATAFGHLSGWKEIELYLRRSSAGVIQILLGQAYFQTEPQLLDRIMQLQEGGNPHRFEVKLASAIATFHPKVWIIEDGVVPCAIVGSGNLSHGGLSSNIECGIFTNRPAEVAALRDWFRTHWSNSPAISQTLEIYRAMYDEIAATRKQLRSKIRMASRELVDREAAWRRRDALTLAAKYWRTEEGRGDVKVREDAIYRMMGLIDFPWFNFEPEHWRKFFRTLEFGRLRPANEKRTIEALVDLKGILKRLVDAGSKEDLIGVLDDLQRIPGIGRNLATKLMAVHGPGSFVVVNKPVERALRAFNYPIKSGTRLTGIEYFQLLEDLKPFIQESERAGLMAVPALDAFFYKYRDLEKEPKAVGS